MTGTGLVFDDEFLKHDTGAGHPECGQRLVAMRQRFEAEQIFEKTVGIGVREATAEELRRAHGAGYLALAEREIRGGVRQLSTGDTVVCEDSWEVAVKAAGGVLNAVDAVMAGEVANAFCATRPPGHHATADVGMGFCVVNHVAVAARHAQAVHGVKRVVIVDWDVHHGNGTQDIFYGDGSVFYFSTHQWPLYPGTGRATDTGKGNGEGATLNVPVAAGGGMAEIGAAFRGEFMAAMRQFKPELVVLSAGFDSRTGDPLGALRLRDEDFVELTGLLLELAGGKLVSVLEGGYNTEGLSLAAAAHVGRLLEG